MESKNNLTISKKYEKFIRRFQNRAGFDHTLYIFPNGYGASVINGQAEQFGPLPEVNSYGLEVAVIRYTDIHEDFPMLDKYELDFDTTVTDDVIGYIDDLDLILEQIKDLPKTNMESE